MEKNSIIVIIIAIVVIGVVVFLLTGSSNTQSTNLYSATTQVTVTAKATSTASESYSVDISGFAFNSASISIKAGDSVTWTNKDSAMHTVTSDSGSELGSNSLGNGETYSHTFTAPGTYAYHCKFHPSMKGTIIVS